MRNLILGLTFLVSVSAVAGQGTQDLLNKITERENYTYPTKFVLNAEQIKDPLLEVQMLISFMERSGKIKQTDQKVLNSIKQVIPTKSWADLLDTLEK